MKEEMIDEVRLLLGEALQLGDRTSQMEPETPLLGNYPEFDSMAVVTVITMLEDQYGFVVEDDEISADTFATLAALTRFVEEKVGG